MTYKIYDTEKSLKALKRAMKSSARVFYTRFGDNDVLMMNEFQGTLGNNLTQWSQALQDELRASLNIKDPNYLKGISLDYEKEKGMAEGLFAPFGNKDELIEKLGQVLTTQEKTFYNPVLFHYLACFKPQKLKNFITEFIRPKKKLFIGNCDQANMELMFGPIDHYVEVPRKNAYAKIDKWWPKVLKVIDSVDVVLPCAGQATRAVQGRLWNLGAEVHSIDLGSVVDAMDGQTTRTWLQLKGQDVRNFFDDTLKIDVVVPYHPGNLGAAYNEAMAKAEDWVLFLDHDFMLLNPGWYNICLNAIRQVGHKAGWISAVTNRIYCPAQRITFDDTNRDTNNIEDHIKYSNNVWAQHGGKIHKATKSEIPFSGFFILTHKEAWRKVGGFGDGFLGVDNDYYNKLMLAGYDSYVLPGLYGYHIRQAKSLYKMGPDMKKKPDLKLVEKKTPEIKKRTVSVIMIVKDEEKNLPRCFESLKGLYDELIVVDTGSTDKTMEICKEYGAKLFEHSWKDFSTHRNQSVGYASGEWLFQMDADEELDWSNITPAEFREWLFSLPDQMAHIDFMLDDVRGGKIAAEFPVGRCFRGGRGLTYYRYAHNRPVIQGENLHCDTLRFRHYGYDISFEKKEAKATRSIPLLKKQIKENPADYACYFYLCSFYVDLNETSLAIEYGQKYIKFKPFLGQNFNHSIYYTMANLYIRIEDFDRAHQCIIDGLKDRPGDLDLNMIYTQYGVMVSDANIVMHGAKQFINAFDAYNRGEGQDRVAFVFTNQIDAYAYCHYQLSTAYLQAGMHVLKKLGGVLPKASEQLQKQLEKDCKARLIPVGLYNAATKAMGGKDG